MSAGRRLFPHPLTSAVLLLVWLLLQQSLSPGNLLLGAALATLVPHFTRRFWPEGVRVTRPGVVLRFFAVVLWDILYANFSVAAVVLGPSSAVRPGFVRMPVDLESDFALTVLASTVSLTPGTVSAEVSADRHHLLVHYLACDDEAELMRSIKQRYESPLKEIFAC